MGDEALDEVDDEAEEGTLQAVGRFGGRRGTREILIRRKVLVLGRTRFCVERDFVMLVFVTDRFSTDTTDGARRE